MYNDFSRLIYIIHLLMYLVQYDAYYRTLLSVMYSTNYTWICMLFDKDSMVLILQWVRIEFTDEVIIYLITSQWLTILYSCLLTCGLTCLWFDRERNININNSIHHNTKSKSNKPTTKEISNMSNKSTVLEVQTL